MLCNLHGGCKVARRVDSIAAKHKVRPNQASTWKRRAIDGLSEVFSNRVDRARRVHKAQAMSRGERITIGHQE